jgi:hypothetical protein
MAVVLQSIDTTAPGSPISHLGREEQIFGAIQQIPRGGPSDQQGEANRLSSETKNTPCYQT